ncbi:two-component system, response regulator YesN [Lachnospiraceae bacterium]|nr:two-component system, response regulator YesN [Lachnospiraceae bacterium]
MKVVVVEDEIRIREGIVRLLGKFGEKYEVVGEAIDGEEGVSLCLELEPELIITDIKMPKKDGLEMLTELKARNVDFNAIVLSAYSEFDYAKRAIGLGVTNYLLKPVSVPEFRKTLEEAEHKINEKKARKPAQIGTLEQILRDIILHDISVEDDTAQYLQNNYNIAPDQKFFIICDYLGKNFEKDLKEKKTKLRSDFSFYKGIDYIVFESKYHKSLIVLIYHYEDVHDIERWIQFQELLKSNEEMTLGCIEVAGIHEIGRGLERLIPYMDWNIAFGKQILISYPKITQVHAELCTYPTEIESACKVALCSNDLEKFTALLDSFNETFFNGSVYLPKDIKECYVRFIWKMIELSRDLSYIGSGKMEYQKLLGDVMSAKKREELIEICDWLVSEVSRGIGKTEDTKDLSVLRTKSIINEFYKTGITLDEIASKLNLTPEYLGTKFHKETGVSFKNYMRDVRINKAKELLTGTNLKLYEIAGQVGYNDSKYFSKVFREVTGQLPADYRKTAV